jgi:nitrite reductase/ring-hydroxylating ferredoxin subunit
MKSIVRNILVGIALFAVIGILQACGGATAAQPKLPPAAVTTSSVQTTGSSSVKSGKGPVKATWITPELSGDTVSIPVSEVESNGIIHFKLAGISGGKPTTYMAYYLDGALNVRANVCPPCRSIGFSLDRGVLVCDTCRTRFDAGTGEGISGACVGYPKAAAAYQLNGDNISMNVDDLLAAYQDTTSSGLP